jgi:glycosyltransferase involved in cell wall biosynthesis/GT2 family glycosyltransferase
LLATPAKFLAARYSSVRLEQHPEPLSFARSVNHGIKLARYSHVCLLNNDMLLEPGFFAPLLDAFDAVPDLFCATAQILFPAGARREETGKAVMAKQAPEDFPICCQEPVPGENLSYVLYGSGGCSLYAANKLHALGGMKELYEPAYVEDLDLGYRGWQRGWPTVFVSAARVLHRHRATTSKYYSSEQLQVMVEVNYLRFLAGTVSSQRLFRKLWSQAIQRLFLRAVHGDPAAAPALLAAPQMPLLLSGGDSSFPEERILALGNGQHAVFPARRPRNKPVVLILSPYLPFPLAHGGAVRMYNLMKRAAADFEQVLISFCDRLETPPQELCDICLEIILVERQGTHALPSSRYPDGVEEFRSETFRGVLQQTMRKWRPQVAQLEFTQMAQYAADCAPAKTLLVEHDLTFDLYAQLLHLNEDWETRRQFIRWRHFEREAWRGVDRVITMSGHDRCKVTGAPAMVLANGVDLDRFRPAHREPEPRRLLFIGALRHLPNLLALEYFLNQIWPHLHGATLHIVAGPHPEYFLERYRSRVQINLNQPGIELDGFVEDVRTAYARAAVVVAPLLASAGTNIKIPEALAMGKAIVSTRQGINGFDLQPGEDVLVAETPVEMVRAIDDLLNDAEMRRRLELQAHRRAEQDYSWDLIARRQRELYRELGCVPHLQAATEPSSFDSQSSFVTAASGRDFSVAAHSG